MYVRSTIECKTLPVKVHEGIPNTTSSSMCMLPKEHVLPHLLPAAHSRACGVKCVTMILDQRPFIFRTTMFSSSYSTALGRTFYALFPGRLVLWPSSSICVEGYPVFRASTSACDVSWSTSSFSLQAIWVSFTVLAAPYHMYCFDLLFNLVHAFALWSMPASKASHQCYPCCFLSRYINSPILTLPAAINLSVVSVLRRFHHWLRLYCFSKTSRGSSVAIWSISLHASMIVFVSDSRPMDFPIW